jgi:hypothetical protein
MYRYPKPALFHPSQMRRFFCILLAVLFVRPDGRNALAEESLEARLSRIASEMCAKLRLQKEVRVIVAPKNPKMVSVERLRDPDERFVVTFDRQFLDTLNEGEFTAALAHEFGHIWIFSHFPYLHTEQLANEIALRAVSRRDLENLYTKLQTHLGKSEGMEEFLGHYLPAARETRQPVVGTISVADRLQVR